MFEVNWSSLVLPTCYILALTGTYVTFTSIYRKRKAVESANLEPWFPPHLQRNIYLSLLHIESDDGTPSEKKTPKIPDSILRAALLRRAVEDIQRIVQLRTAKTACSSLLQRGSVGDDLWQRFVRAEKEMENEIREVVVEANALTQGWGNTIFQSANEIVGNTLFRKRIDEIQAKADGERERWEKRRGEVPSVPIAQPKEETQPSTVPVTTATSTPVKPAAAAAAVANKTSSDDGVLVDRSTPGAETPGSKKKKGRK